MPRRGATRGAGREDTLGCGGAAARGGSGAVGAIDSSRTPGGAAGEAARGGSDPLL